MSENPTQVQVEEAETLLDIEQLNDIDMSTVEDAPEFMNDPPSGIYKLEVSSAKIEKTKNKKGEEKTRIKHIYKVNKVQDLSDKNALVPPEGTLFSETFLATAEGLKYWKQRAKQLLGDLGNASLKDVIQNLNEGIVFDAKVGTKKTKGEDGTEYTNVQIRPLSEDAISKLDFPA